MSNIEISTVAPLVVSGPSGVGKSYMARRLAEQFRCGLLLSTKTRDMRPGEVHGVDSNFIDDDTFMRLRDEGEIILPGGFYNAHYGYQRSLLGRILEAGETPVMELRTKSIRSFLGDVPLARTVYLNPVDPDSLETNMRRRQDAEADIADRLEQARQEADFYANVGRTYYELELPASFEHFEANLDTIADHFQLTTR